MKQPKIETKVKKWITQHKDLVDALNIGFGVFDHDFGCWFANDLLMEMSGTTGMFNPTPEQFQRVDMRELLTPSEIEEMHTMLEKAEMILTKHKEDKSTNFYEIEWGLRDYLTGKETPVIVRASMQLDSDGNHDFTFMTFTSMLEQKEIQAELENERNKLAAIIFGIGDCVSVYDMSGNLTLRNPQGKEIRGNEGKALIPLHSGSQDTISIKIKGKTHHFEAKIETVKDENDDTCAYVEILQDVTNRIKLKQQEPEFNRLKRKILRLELKSEMIGSSPNMKNVLDLVVRCSEVDSTILIQGETGVGKEVVAKTIHNRSSRKNKPFIAVNCGALPENLIESELFGHVKGAFTGATTNTTGLFLEANDGTIFLDEVGDLSMPIQVKLLRVLQEREVRPVGGSKSYPINVRIITATNIDIKEMAVQNLYRQDLYYRLAVIPILVPPLRERKEDILLLADHFLNQNNNEPKNKIKKLDHQSQKALLQYSWPGNIRELENCIEYVRALSKDNVIALEDLPAQIALSEESPTLPQQEVSSQQNTYSTTRPSSGDHELKPWELEEKTKIEEVIISQKGNRTKSSKELGISRQTLWRLILKYRISI